MTELSPAAEAVLNAVTFKRYDVPYYACPNSINQIKSDVAAALRAVVDQVLAKECPPIEDYNEYDQGFAAAHIKYRNEILAIAGELEAQ